MLPLNRIALGGKTRSPYEFYRLFVLESNCRNYPPLGQLIPTIATRAMMTTIIENTSSGTWFSFQLLTGDRVHRNSNHATAQLVVDQI